MMGELGHAFIFAWRPTVHASLIFASCFSCTADLLNSMSIRLVPLLMQTYMCKLGHVHVAAAFAETH